MNRKTNTPEMQEEKCADTKRGRKPTRMLPPANLEGMREQVETIRAGLRSYTWKDLETKGKFSKNEKLSFISEDMLVVGCDVGSETHYARAIDWRGRELSGKAFPFSNDASGFQMAREWALDIAVRNGKNQIVLGFEPTGHYWFALAVWMVSNGISVVQVNPHAVNKTKEVEDNSQAKDDRKDPKLIANLVKDGNYGMPYLPEDVYAEMRALSMMRDQLTEDKGRDMNRLHRELKIVFPEYREAFSKIDGDFTISLLKRGLLPSDLAKLGEEGIRKIWHEDKLRGAGYRRVKDIVNFADKSVGLTQGSEARRKAIVFFANQIEYLTAELKEIEAMLAAKCREIPFAENILEIKGLGVEIMAGIVSEMGDISRFDDAKEIQKLSGLGLVACSSGKHKGQTQISRRGRKKLRYWLFQGALSVVSHNEAFKRIHLYYTTRAENPLKKMQSLIVIACKLLRIIFTILKRGVRFDPDRMLKDIVYPETAKAVA